MVVICPYIEDIKPEITVFLLTSNGFVFQATHDGCDFARGGVLFHMKFTKETSSIRKCFEERSKLRTPVNLICHFARNGRIASNKMKITIFITNTFLICTVYLFCSHIVTRIDTIANISFDIFLRFRQSPILFCWQIDKVNSINISVHIVLLYNSFIILILYFKFHKKSNLCGHLKILYSHMVAHT